MNTYIVQSVGEPMGPLQTVDAPNAFHAVAHVASCSVSDVCLPIWTDATRHRDRAARLACFMPLDGSGRQWKVTRQDGQFLAADYRIG